MKEDEFEDTIDPVKDRYLLPGESFSRLRAEFKKHGSLCIGYDFDGTVHDFHQTGDTYPRLIKLLRDLKSIGCKCYCWTAYPDLNYVEKYLKDNNIPCDGVNCEGIPLGWESRKPFYSAILDDRAGLRDVVRDLELLIINHKLEQDESNTQH